MANNLKPKVIFIRDAVRRIMDHQPHEISVWEQSSGVILEYHKATYVGGCAREGQFRVKLADSLQIRQFCEIELRMVDGLRVTL